MYAANLAQKARELKREKRKSDTLLFQMLPLSVAQQLKQTQQVLSHQFRFLFSVFILKQIFYRDSIFWSPPPPLPLSLSEINLFVFEL